MKVIENLSILYCLLGLCCSSLGDKVPAHTQAGNCETRKTLERVETAFVGLRDEVKVLNVKTANISDQMRNNLAGHLEFLRQTPWENVAPPVQTQRPKQIGVLDSLIENPKAKLYKSTHFTGNVTNYDFSSFYNFAGGCYEPDGNWKSVDPGQSCVRLFEGDTCKGKSLALYPGSKNNENVGALLSRVWSVGPCLQNEFAFATFSRTSAGVLVAKSASNLRQVPDLIDIGGYYAFHDVSKYPETGYPGSIFKYYMENGRRVKYMYASIYRKHVQSPVNGTISSEVIQHWNALEKQKGDQMGLIVPTNLGGLRNDTFNIFPQSPANAFEWKKITDRALEILQTPCVYTGVKILVNFLYENSDVTRPYALTYNLNACSNGVIQNGFIPN